MTRVRLRIAAALLFSAGTALVVACTGELNPQPLPPFTETADAGASSSSSGYAPPPNASDAGAVVTSPKGPDAAGADSDAAPQNAPDAGLDAGDGGKDAGDAGDAS